MREQQLAKQKSRIKTTFFSRVTL